MAHSTEYGDLEVYDIDSFLDGTKIVDKNGAKKKHFKRYKINNELIRIMGKDNYDKLIKISKNNLFINVTTRKKKKYVFWSVGSYSDNYGINLTFVGSSEKQIHWFIDTLFHELNAAANPDLTHKKNTFDVYSATEDEIADLLDKIEKRFNQIGDMPKDIQMPMIINNIICFYEEVLSIFWDKNKRIYRVEDMNKEEQQLYKRLHLFKTKPIEGVKKEIIFWEQTILQIYDGQKIGKNVLSDAKKNLSIWQNALDFLIMNRTDFAGADNVKSKSEDIESWIEMIESRKEETIEKCGKNLFNGELTMINIGFSEEVSGEIFEYLQTLGMVIKKEIDNLVFEARLGDIQIRFFNDNKEGREKLIEKIKRSGIKKEDRQKKIITFSYKGEDNSCLEEESYVVYLNNVGENTVSPIQGCFIAGLEYLYQSELRTRTKKDKNEINGAIERFAKNLAAIQGTFNYVDILERITKQIDEDDIRELVNTGEIIIKIKPIDINKISYFYKLELKAMKSL